MTEPLVSTRSLDEGRVLLLSLNRDEKRNALNVELCHELEAAIKAAEKNEHCRAVVMATQGRVFSAGADLDSHDFAGELYPAMTKALGCMRTSSLPIVGYIQGPAIGAGAMLAMACDLRVVAPEASFRIPITDMAIGVNGLAVKELTKLVGGARARAMLLLGAQMSAQQAVECGLALQVGAFEDAVGVAKVLSLKAPLTVANLKLEFVGANDADRERARMAAWNSNDHREALRARAEKRAPEFKGS